jgi:hypothetical protein
VPVLWSSWWASCSLYRLLVRRDRRGRPSLSTPSAPPSSSVRNAVFVPANVGSCGVLGPSPASVADQPNYSANVSALWSDLCNTTAFIAVIDEWGGLRLLYPGSQNGGSYWAAANLGLPVGGRDGGVPTVRFVVAWAPLCDSRSQGSANGPCSYQEAWSGNFSTDRVGGPFSSERTAICSSGPSPAGTPLPLGRLAVAACMVAAALSGVAAVLRWRRRPRDAPREAASV